MRLPLPLHLPLPLTLPLLLSLSLLWGCGGEGEGRPSPSPPAARSEPSAAAAPIYDLHEWGVVAVRPGSFEVAAGAGQRLPTALTVDKPVLYVHPETEQAFDLSLRVLLPEGLSVAEHFPPAELTPLRWQARVEHQGCRGSYPQAGGDDVDGRCLGGYCERYELALYEAEGAACLSVGEERAPLLFYRLWAPTTPPELPLVARLEGAGLEGERVIVQNRGLRSPIGQLWRITRGAEGARASASPVPAIGQEAQIGLPTGAAAAGRRAMLAAIREQGLLADEAAAFDRGWGEALFGAATTQEVPAADVLTADETQLDRLSDDEDGADRPARDPRLPRDADVLLYWLPAESVEALARIEAEPAPRHLRRAFLVRVVLR